MSQAPSSDNQSAGHTSLYALPALVGRNDLIEQAANALQPDSSCRVVYFLGQGGIGKTRILEALIRRLNEEVEAKGRGYVTDRVVDLYHTVTHTKNGLADALYDAAPFLEAMDMEELRKEMTGLWVAGVAGHSAELRQEHIALFEGVLRDACQRRPAHFALDTAERLLYHPLAGALALPEHAADAWAWLMDLLQENPNLRLIIAGRPESEPLLNDLQKQLGADAVVKMEVPALDKDGAIAYFEQIEDLANKHNDQELLERLNAFTPDWRERVADWSQGVPIRLALTIDYLLMSEGDLPEPEADREWEAVLFQHLMDERREVFETLAAVGRLPKGADARLLARVMNVDEAEAEERLQAIRPLTVTKVLEVPGVGWRYFLHDEMYRLLNKHYYNSPWDAPAKSEAQKGVAQYYEERLQQWRKEMQSAFLGVEAGQDEDCPDVTTRVRLYRQRHALLTEDVYYALRRDIGRGFRRRYRYTRDADLSGDVALDYALQAELLRFFGELDPAGTRDRFNGVERKQVEGILAMRPVVRAWVEERYKDVWEKAKSLRDSEFTDIPLNSAILNAWEAYARVMAGENLQQAKKLLDEAVGLTAQYENQSLNQDMTVWRAKAILATALRVRGYLLDNQGDLDEAIEDYRRAAGLWREVNLQVEMATTTKDLAFNLARKGEFGEARDLARNALNLHRKLAAPGPIGLSLNAMANIYLEEGHYQDAREMARRALRLFECISFTRGIGLACLALSEAMRRRAGAAELLSSAERFERLKEAETYAIKGKEALERIGDQWYLLHALIELGCVMRDKVKVCHADSRIEECDQQKQKVNTYQQESEKLLKQAANMAEESGYDNLRADALVNLAWLGYYARDKTLSDWAEAEMRQAFPKYFDRGEPTPTAQPSAADTAVWEQLGKLYVAKGAWAYAEFKDDGAAEQALRRMGRLYTQALEYSSMRGRDYRNLRLGKSFIYEQLMSLNVNELKSVAAGVAEAEAEFDRKPSQMQLFLRERSLWYGKEAGQ